MKVVRCYIISMFCFFLLQIFGVMHMIDLSKADCEAIGAQIVNQEGGNKICRYVRK